jgi:5'-3' exoribonuclease 2
MGNNNYKFIKNLYINHIDKEVEISMDGMRGTVLLSEDCVIEGGTLRSPVRGLPVRNNEVYWFVLRYNFNIYYGQKYKI